MDPRAQVARGPEDGGLREDDGVRLNLATGRAATRVLMGYALYTLERIDYGELLADCQHRGVVETFEQANTWLAGKMPADVEDVWKAVDAPQVVYLTKTAA